MFSNIDHTHPAVRADLLAWGEWMVSAIGIHGFRLDAAQHFSSTFTREWLARVQAVSERARARPPLVIGEVWAAENSRQIRWLDAVDPASASAPSSPSAGSRSRVYAFDAPLLYNFSRLSEAILAREKGDRRAKPDLRTLLSGPGNPELRPLVALRPAQAVTFVTSHDTQPGQTCAVPMDSGLKALFYAFVLLRREGRPCVFWGDLYGTKGPEAEGPACRVAMGRHENAGGAKKEEEKRSLLPSLMLARKLFAYGTQEDYMDAMECVGWTRAGTRDREGCVVVLSIVSGSRWASKRMRAGKPGEKWVNALDQESDRTEVFIDKRGFGIFTCKGTGVSIYVRQQGKSLGRFPVTYNHDAFVEG